MIAVLGVDSEPEDVAVVARGVDAAEEVLAAPEHGALSAAVAAMVEMDGIAVSGDDVVLGQPAHVRLGDAAVSGPGCWFASVAAVEGVAHPAQAAKALCGAHHPILAGDGASDWARAMGLAVAVPELSSSAPAASSAPVDAGVPDATPPSWKSWEWLVGDPTTDAGSRDASLDGQGDIDAAAKVAIGPSAVVVRDATGAYAGALSTVWSEPGEPGRLTDISIPGAALYVGDAGAVAISGRDAELARWGLAKETYALLDQNRSARDAAEWAVAQVQDGVHVAVVVVGRSDYALRSTTRTAWAARSGDDAESSASKARRVPGPAGSKGGARP